MKHNYTIPLCPLVGKREATCKCAGCTKPNCGTCKMCLDMPKFGGPGRKKKRCLQRKCILTESHASPIKVHGFTLTLDEHDFNTLNHLDWLNDQVNGHNNATHSYDNTTHVHRSSIFTSVFQQTSTTNQLKINLYIHLIHFSILNYKKMDFLELNAGLSR